MTKTVCIFCSTFNPENRFLDEVTHLSELFSEKKINMVYGGGDKGLMGHAARSMINKGVKVTGIVPKFLMKYIDRNIGFHRLIETKDMHERKLTMYSLSDIFLVLPGGIGTLDEMTEVLTWNQLGVHTKKVIIGNFEEFWTPYIDLLIHLNKFKYLSDLSRINYSIASNASDILKLIEAPDH
ncbi:MAG: TIGR00730 family Rossman fold protein [Pseudomonadota bacterium]|nr:TIGR00730 family Rossman fold protein [Hyphomicrobiales bacterium]MBS70855.1 TIGR00730 family Rossman fold protein [Rhodobiaceae bacterium]MEC8404449.1 TIGR00730 family Rossman fold protein [Pseudomonadota bacterium]MEC8453024.1 TIGR00730 family Rossman fold protein [Pseudomonadota bacterium]MEC8497235.1 TIGR00730 family Rossman fold protein [Pseudomonadota bacterium]|tara:strand:+ start:327 stop:872 length:546 start_codon:yes stop_codon:yes gene_type:complete